MSSVPAKPIYSGDVEFAARQFSALTCELRYEKPSCFVERVRYLPKELTPFPGKFSFDKFPYFRKPLDCLDPNDPTVEVVIMKGNQGGGTAAVLENAVLYNIVGDPHAQLYVTADAGLAKKTMQTRIEPMIDYANVRHLIRSQSRKSRGSKNTGDTMFEKEYPGGYLHAFGGRSPRRFRGLSYPRIWADEVDSFPHEIAQEGSVVDLVRNRANAYAGNKKKILWISTPLVEQTSKIEQLYLSGTCEKYFVPCKHCGTMQELVWHGENKETGYTWGIVWENDEKFNPVLSTVAYKCCNPECGKTMKNYDKSVIIPKGEWRETAKPSVPTTKSFHITPLYNPPGMYTWEDMVTQWAGCWDIKKNRVKDKEKYRLFRNTKQGLTFEDFGVQITHERAIQYRRTGFITGKVPNDLAVEDTGTPILILVASVDVQNDRLYYDIKGYSGAGSAWTVDFDEIKGNTADYNGPWDKLDEIIGERRFTSTDGKAYQVAITLIGSGHNAEWVYAYVKKHSYGVYACKGKDWIAAGESYQLFSPASLERIGMAQAYHINTGKLKDKISAALMSSFWKSREYQPPWYPNFPEDFRDDYFKMFEAETKVEKRDSVTKQFRGYVWKLDFGKPNHAFDTYVYNLAALEIFAEDFCKSPDGLGLAALDWDAFWAAAQTGVFYGEAG